MDVFCSEGSPKTQLWSVRELTSVNEVASVLTLKHRLPQCGQCRREPAGASFSPPAPALTWECLASRIRAGLLSVCLQLWGACPVPRGAARLVGCSTS